jgi:hypothetical protein
MAVGSVPVPPPSRWDHTLAGLFFLMVMSGRRQQVLPPLSFVAPFIFISLSYFPLPLLPPSSSLPSFCLIPCLSHFLFLSSFLLLSHSSFLLPPYNFSLPPHFLALCYTFLPLSFPLPALFILLTDPQISTRDSNTDRVPTKGTPISVHTDSALPQILSLWLDPRWKPEVDFPPLSSVLEQVPAPQHRRRPVPR